MESKKVLGILDNSIDLISLVAPQAIQSPRNIVALFLQGFQSGF
jgi:hypothetical protein